MLDLGCWLRPARRTSPILTNIQDPTSNIHPYTEIMEAVIIDCLRTAAGKAPRGALRNTRPDEMAAVVVRRLLEKYPQVAPADVEDVIIGCAMPEAESGNNM